MEKFRKQIKRSFYLMISIMLLLPGVLILLSSKLGEYAEGGMTNAFLMGMMSAFYGIMIYLVIVFGRAMKDEEKLKKLYVKRHDERQEFIKKQMAINTIVMFLAAMYIAIIVAGYKDAVVFETLVYTLIGFGLILSINKIILMKKH